MSKKKCRMCCEDAKWEWNDKFYCQFCLRIELTVRRQNAPRICEMCGAHLDDVYYTDDEDNPFCSAECALRYNDACEIEEEQEDDE